MWQGWHAAARECSSPHSEKRSGSFDDSAAVHVPYVSSYSSTAGQIPPQEVGAVHQGSSVSVEQQTRRNGSGRASQKWETHVEPTQYLKMPAVDPVCTEAGQPARQLSFAGNYSGGYSWDNPDHNNSAVMRSHVEMLNALPGPVKDLQSGQPQQSHPGSAEAEGNAPQPSSGVLRENITANQVAEVSTNGAKSLGPSGGPGALAPSAAGQMRPRKAGGARGGKRAGRQAGRGGRGPGPPAAPLMLATFEGAAQGEMRARLDAVRKLQEDTAAAEAKSGRGRRLRR